MTYRRETRNVASLESKVHIALGCGQSTERIGHPWHHPWSTSKRGVTPLNSVWKGRDESRGVAVSLLNSYVPGIFSPEKSDQTRPIEDYPPSIRVVLVHVRPNFLQELEVPSIVVVVVVIVGEKSNASILLIPTSHLPCQTQLRLATSISLRPQRSQANRVVSLLMASLNVDVHYATNVLRHFSTELKVIMIRVTIVT